MQKHSVIHITPHMVINSSILSYENVGIMSHTELNDNLSIDITERIHYIISE